MRDPLLGAQQVGAQAADRRVLVARLKAPPGPVVRLMMSAVFLARMRSTTSR